MEVIGQAMGKDFMRVVKSYSRRPDQDLGGAATVVALSRMVKAVFHETLKGDGIFERKLERLFRYWREKRHSSHVGIESESAGFSPADLFHKVETWKEIADLKARRFRAVASVG